MSQDDKKQTAPRMGKPTFLILLAGFAVGAGYFYNKLDYVGVATVTAIAFSCFSGFRLGATRIAASLLGIAAAIALAPQLGVSQEHHFAEWFGTAGLGNRFLSIGVIGVLISLVVTVVAILITNRLLKDRPRLTWSNCWLGFLIGGAEATLAVALLLGGILIIEPLEQDRAELRDQDDARGQNVGNAIVTIAAKTRASQLGPWIEKYNPFTRIPQLNQVEKIQNTVQVLSDPDQINHLLHHPAMTELQQRPAMKRAVNRLMSDPDIKQILHSGKTIDGSTAMTLLNHPAVLELVDQPGFLAEANKIIDDAGLLEKTNR